MNKQNWIFILSVLAFFAWGCTSEGKCDCDKKDDSLIIIDTQDTAYVKNARVLVVEGSEEVYIIGGNRVRLSKTGKSIIIDTQDTARIVIDSTNTELLDSLLDRIRRNAGLGLKMKK